MNSRKDSDKSHGEELASEQNFHPLPPKSTTIDDVRNVINDLWKQRDKKRNQLGQIQKKLEEILNELEEVDDRKIDGIDIAAHKEHLEQKLMEMFDIDEEKDLATKLQKERFDTELQRAFKKIQLSEIEDRMERANMLLKELDAEASPMGLEDYDPYSLDLYIKLITLEGKLRRMIEHAFKNEKKWWKTRLPEDVRKRANEKIERDRQNKKDFETRSFNKIEYLEFSDYREIVRKGDNDVYFFSNGILPKKEILLTRLEELEPMRNVIVHRPPLDEADAKKFNVFFNELSESIDKFFSE